MAVLVVPAHHVSVGFRNRVSVLVQWAYAYFNTSGCAADYESGALWRSRAVQPGNNTQRTQRTQSDHRHSTPPIAATF